MSERVDQFCEGLRGRLTGIEEHLGQIQNRVTTAGNESRAQIEGKVAELKAKWQSWAESVGVQPWPVKRKR